MSKKMILVLLLAFFLGYAGSYFIPPSETISRLANITSIDIPSITTTTTNTTQVATLTNTTTSKTTITKTHITNKTTIIITKTSNKTSTSTTTTKRVDESSVINRTELTLYALNLINTDRLDSDVEPVELGALSTAQDHADDLASMCVLSHWDSGGMKPYMRYSLAGGGGVVSENAAIQTWTMPVYITETIIKEAIGELEYEMMYNDAESNWGHRDNIIEPLHNKASIGIAWGKDCIVYIQHFEDDYIDWVVHPTLNEFGWLRLSGDITRPLSELSSLVSEHPNKLVLSLDYLTEILTISIAYDSLPEAMTAEDLKKTPGYYMLGDWAGQVLSPPPSGWYYPDLNETDVIASRWSVQTLDSGARFEIEASIKPIIDKYGKGVYTITLWVISYDPHVMLTEISIFVE